MSEYDDILRRLERLEKNDGYLFDDVSDLERESGRHDSLVHILGSQLKTLTDKPPPWHNIIAAASVLVTIGVLALTPVAWLAVNNFNANQQDAAQDFERGYMAGQVAAQVAAQERRLDLLEEELERRRDE